MPDADRTGSAGLTDLDQRLGRLADSGAAQSDVPPPALVRRRADREQRHRRVAATAVGGLVAAAAAVAVVGGPAVLRAGEHARLPAQRPAAGEGALRETPAHTDRRVAIGTVMTLSVPAGWYLYQENGYTPAHGWGATRSYCLARPDGFASPVSGCSGLSIQAGPRIAGNEGSVPYRPHEAAGWYTGTDVSPCPVGRPSTSDYLNGVDPGGRPVRRGLRAVGSHQANYDRWRATCADGSVFSPQAWYLPESRVLVKAQTPVAGTDRILASALFVRDGAALPEPAEPLNGRVVAATDGEVRLATAAGMRRLRLTDLTACIGGSRLTGHAGTGVATAIPCSAFARWLAAHPDRSLPVGVAVDRSGRLAQVAERLP